MLRDNMLRSNLQLTKESPFKLVNGLLNDCRPRTRQLAVKTKPPNILIVTEKEESISQWRHLLESVLSKETYVIYGLGKQDLTKGIWQSYTSLLILDHVRDLSHTQKTLVESYLLEGGKTLCHCSLHPFKDGDTNAWYEGCSVDLAPTQCYFKSEKEHQYVTAMVHTPKDQYQNKFSDGICMTHVDDIPILMSSGFGGGKMVLSWMDIITTQSKLQANGSNPIEMHNLALLLKTVMQNLGLQVSCRNQTSERTSKVGYMMGDPQQAIEFAENVKRHGAQLNDDCHLKVIESTVVSQDSDVSDGKFLVTLLKDPAVAGAECGNGFNFTSYWEALKSCRLGRLLLYTDVIESTQTFLSRIIEMVPDPHGFMIVAGRQTKGKGRAGNIWLSPYGCMMFSIAICISSSSVLGQRIPFLQHIASVALVMAVKEQPGYETVSVGIKWPNDIYVGDKIKIGGLIVNSSFSNGVFNAIIGMGVNVSNEKPTVCLNSIIEEHNLSHNTRLECLTTEQLLGRTVTNMEKLIELFEFNGSDAFCSVYYKYWLHSNQRVNIFSEKEAATVRGLDSNGFLLVENDNGKLLSLQPDGNSFDMMQGLITIKSK